MKILATYLTRKFQDSGSDGAPDYYVYWFTNIVDEQGMKLKDKWIKQTKLMQAVDFVKGVEYNLTLSGSPYSKDSINLPYPIEVSWAKGKVFMRNGNSIIKIDSSGNEINLSEPLFKSTGTENYYKGFFNKFHKGILTVDELQKMNSRGVFYQITVIDPQDKRMNDGYRYSYNGLKNFIQVAQESEEKIDQVLRVIGISGTRKDFYSQFEIIREILPPKKRKGAK